jgi:hypothetical protein
MRTLGRRGGLATKRLANGDPNSYRRIGWYGGKASAAARRRRIAAALESGDFCDGTIEEREVEVEEPQPVARRPLTLADILAESEMGASAPKPTQREDAVADESFRRFLARARGEELVDDEEPWSERD